MYGYIVCTFKHIDNLDDRANIQSAILNYVTQHKSSKKYIVEEYGAAGDNPHWNIFLEHKKPAHILAVFEGYYTEKYWSKQGKTVTTQTIRTDIDASFVLIGYLTKEKNAKVIYDNLTDKFKKDLTELYSLHDHKVKSPESVVKRFCRLTDSEFINMLYDSFYDSYKRSLDSDFDFDITKDEFRLVVMDIGKEYNIQQHLNKLKSFYVQLKMQFSICKVSELDIW